MTPMLINQAIVQAEQFMCVIVKKTFYQYQQCLQVYQLTQLLVVMSQKMVKTTKWFAAIVCVNHLS